MTRALSRGRCLANGTLNAGRSRFKYFKPFKTFKLSETERSG